MLFKEFTNFCDEPPSFYRARILSSTVFQCVWAGCSWLHSGLLLENGLNRWKCGSQDSNVYAVIRITG